MSGVTLEEKLQALNISLVDDDVYNDELAQLNRTVEQLNDLVYYKMYGDTPMFYTKKYIETHSLEYLIEQDKRNRENFLIPPTQTL